jgi:cell cycle checkpoint protein
LSTHQEESSSETEDDEDANDPQTVQHTTPAATYSSRKRGRKGVDNAIADAILEMASASKMRAAAIEQLNSKYSVADCIKYLDLMQGVDQQLYFSALDLFNNPNAREVFLSLKKDKRLTWLHRRCAVVYDR